MSWQAFLNDQTDGTIYSDYMKFEQAFNAAVKAGKVPPAAQIVLRKAPKVPVVPRAPEVPQGPVVLIPPPAYTVPRMQAQRQVQGKANLTMIVTVALIVGIAVGIYLGVR